MRSLLEVKTEIAEIMSSEYDKKSEIARARKRLQFLRTVEMYLEGNPTDWFIKKEIERLENRNNKIIEQYNIELYKSSKNPKKKYEEEMGIPHIRLQLKALRFIKK
jgi:hypothetical protein